mgnify:CR=1 FL=1
MPPDPLLSLDPRLQQAVRSTVLTAKWKHGPADTYIGDKRIHVYQVKRMDGRVCWALVAKDLSETIACGVL